MKAVSSSTSDDDETINNHAVKKKQTKIGGKKTKKKKQLQLKKIKRSPFVSKLLQLCNDVEANPGPTNVKSSSGNGDNIPAAAAAPVRRKSKTNNALPAPINTERGKMTTNGISSSGGKGSSNSGTNGKVTAAADERHEQLQGRLGQLETKYETLLERLSKYDVVAQELEDKNKVIDDLRNRIFGLEEAFSSSRQSSSSSLQVPSSISSDNSTSVNNNNNSDISSTGSSTDSTTSSGIGTDEINIKPGLKHGVPERLETLERSVGRARIDLGSLMIVYDDLQDRVYDIDRTWKNNLIFTGIRGDPSGIFESSECIENKIRTVLRNKLNIGREIVINRCQRLYCSVDGKGTRPIVVNFFKWSDKEDILRKSKLLKNSGISIEEDLSRAAKLRRRELEKFLREVKAADPDKKCTFKYDKLIIDDSVFIFNQSEHRVERLPYTLSGMPVSFEAAEDTPSATVGRYRMSARGQIRGSTTSLNQRPATTAGYTNFGSGRPFRAKSVECILEKIPSVTNGLAEPFNIPRGGLGPHHNLSRDTSPGLLTASLSTPSLTHELRKERAAAAAREKMVPNFVMSGGEEEEEGGYYDGEEEEEMFDQDEALIDKCGDALLAGLAANQREEDAKKCTNDTPLHASNSCSKSEKVKALKKFIFDEVAVNAKLEELSRPAKPKKPGAASSSSSSDSETDSDPPLNNIVDQEEWDLTGCYFPPARQKGKRNENRKIGKPKLKSSHSKKGGKGSKGSSSSGKEGKKAAAAANGAAGGNSKRTKETIREA